MKFARVKPSQEASILGLIVSLGMFVFGLAVIVPDVGLFGFFWCGMALILGIICALNLFTRRGVATDEIEMESNSRSEKLSIEDKLMRLEELRKKQLITELEYQEKRKELMKQLV